jgi:hypothetical protein
MSLPAAELRTFTPLGVRFWDAVFDAPVGGGLEVTARPLTGSWPEIPAFLTPSGVYAFRGLPGLRRVEYPVGPEPIQDVLPAPAPMAVRVRDRLRRFLPTVVLVPAPHLGVAPMLPAGGSPPDTSPPDASPPGAAVPGIYLFSAPSRRVRSDVAVVRASLADRGSGAPAAHTRLDVVVAGTLWAGVADALGNVAVMLPFPAFGGSAAFPSPPPGTGGVPPEQQSWPVQVRVRYEPAALDHPIEGAAPTLASILAQSPDVLWPDEAGPPVPELPAELSFGRELVLRTQGTEESTLLVGAASP